MFPTLPAQPLISLVMGTLGRTAEVGRFLSGLKAQSYPHFELLIVDQNPDDRLLHIIDPFTGIFPIRRLTSPPGLSRARNRAIPEIRGEIVGFPDDDCFYPPYLLENVARFFLEHPEYTGLSGRVEFFEGRGVGHFSSRSGEITPYNIWFRVTSFTLFLRAEAFAQVGKFAETLGIGSNTPWGSSEDIDLPLRLFKKGCRIFYHPGLVVYHPFQLQKGVREAWKRGLNYGRGIGRVLRIHNYPFWFISYHLTRSICGAMLNLARVKIPELAYYLGGFIGKLQGVASKVENSQEIPPSNSD